MVLNNIVLSSTGTVGNRTKELYVATRCEIGKFDVYKGPQKCLFCSEPEVTFWLRA